jgi:hypothetical protein
LMEGWLLRRKILNQWSKLKLLRNTNPTKIGGECKCSRRVSSCTRFISLVTNQVISHERPPITLYEAFTVVSVCMICKPSCICSTFKINCWKHRKLCLHFHHSLYLSKLTDIKQYINIEVNCIVGQSESINRRRTDNTRTKRKRATGQTTNYKIIHKKLKILTRQGNTSIIEAPFLWSGCGRGV